MLDQLQVLLAWQNLGIGTFREIELAAQEIHCISLNGNCATNCKLLLKYSGFTIRHYN